jgi:hypothetical protein
MEEWRPIPDHRGYEASNYGRVRSTDRYVWQGGKAGSRYRKFWKGQILAQGIDGAGYPSVGTGKRVHVLVMLAFRGHPPDNTEIAHGDGNKLNPRLENLSYKTKSGNEMDKISHGTSNRGERHGMSKLTAEDVLIIRGVIGETQTALAKRFGVTEGCIRRILARKTWGWL